MTVGELIRSAEEAILAEWAEAARALPPARRLSEPVLLDEMPTFLRHLARSLDEGSMREEHETDERAVRHAHDRLRLSFDPRTVVDEYALLRSIVLRRAREAHLEDLNELARFDAAVDRAIATAVAHYAAGRESDAREEAMRVRLATAAAGLGTWEWMLEERVVVCDERAGQMFGVPAGQRILQSTIGRLIHPLDYPRVAQNVRTQLFAEGPSGIEFRVVDSEGRRRWVQAHGQAVELSESGTVIRALGTVLDVSERKLAQQRLEIVAWIGAAFAESHDLEGLLPRLLDSFQHAAEGVDSATIMLRESSGYRVRASIGLPNASGTRFSNADEATRWLQERGVRGVYSVRLGVNAKDVLGIVFVGSRTREEFAEDEKLLLHAAAERASSVVAKRWLADDLARRQSELEAVFEAVPDALVISDTEGITRANRASLDLLGFSTFEELRDADALLPERLALRDATTNERTNLTVLMRARRGERARADVIIRHPKTGRDRFLRVAGAPIVVDGEIRGGVSLSADVTHLVELERQRDAFMNAIVHDLRSPLSTIVTAAGLLMRRSAPDPWVVDRLRKLQNSALRMDRLLADLLDIGLAQTGQVLLKLERVCVADVLEEQATIWATTSNRHRLRVRPCDVWVFADRDRVVQVLDNLLSNAIKYSPHGGEIVLSCEVQESGEACVSVEDHGSGVTEAQQRAIFEAYSRAGGDETVEGHGLGLFISAQLVRQQGGRIGVESGGRTGSRFWFTLPLASPEAATIALH